MMDQEGIRSSDKMASLVLSIFKGENFVVKSLRTPCRVFLKAKCADLQPELALESGAVELTSAVTDPEFNSQLAWSLSKKQLKELRSNRSIIKVTCFVSDRLGTETEVGYVVLHVKDATAFSPGVDVDPSKAITYSLLGTKDYWRTLQPKLQMILHLEDLEKRTQSQPSSVNQNEIKPSLPAPNEPTALNQGLVQGELQIKNAATLSETKILPKRDTNQFAWTVREKDGYFQLGEAADDDDLYILNTTVISASYLHCLWDGKSPRKRLSDNFFWQIKYEAYGCEIASEPFLLGHEDESRRTFIGDKATARIRTNGAMFYEYLQDINLQFQVIRYQLGHDKELTSPEVLGICFASLNELTNPNKREHKVCMEVVSEWGTPRVVSIHEKPEVRVMFTLEAVPNYFKICQAGIENNNNVILAPPPGQHVPSLNGFSVGSGGLDAKSSKNRLGTIGGEKRQQNERRNEDVPDGIDVESVSVSNTSNIRRLLQFEDENRQNESPPPSSSSLLTSPEKCVPHKKSTLQQKQKLSQASSCNYSESEDTDNSSSNKENLARIMPPPGEYNVTVDLSRFWLKSRRVIKDSFMLRYLHQPMGMSQKPVECYAEPLDPDEAETRHGFIVIDGSFTTTLTITRFSENLLNEPLTVEFFRTNEEAKSKCFASAMIPFGRIFSEKGHDNIWMMEDSSDVLKINQNVKIGTLFFKIKLNQKSISPIQAEQNIAIQKQSSFFPPATKVNKSSRSTDKYIPRDAEKMDKIAEDMREYRRAQEEMHTRQKEETETAYLKILSEEAAKRDSERENVMTQKLADLEKKEKELNRKLKQLDEKEERLKQFDTELKDKARKLEMDQESLQQHSSLTKRRLEEDHKIQAEGLTRRLREFQDENEKLKTKVLLLEKKLETKDAEIDNLIALKREHPDANLVQRLSVLEQENKSLKNLHRETNGRKEQYKKQSLALCQKLHRMQEERDQELKDQNENLRLQILATKQHKEVKKEKKAVQDLSHALKALQKETVNPTNRNDGKGDRSEACSAQHRKSGLGVISTSSKNNDSKGNEEEIKRLAAERSKLLRTGAYTNYDSVIKELERKMVSLAKE